MLLFTAVLLLALVGSAYADLVTNGGFETGDFTGWTTTPATSDSVFGINSSNPHTGSYDAYFAASGPYADSISQNISTTPGQLYRISFWLANLSLDPSNSFQVQWGGTTINELIDQQGFRYTYYTFNENATASTESLAFLAWNNTGIYYLDDVSVTSTSSVPIPAAVWLLGSGLIGIAGVRRKFKN
jgi:hypothetical protein